MNLEYRTDVVPTSRSNGTSIFMVVIMLAAIVLAGLLIYRYLATRNGDAKSNLPNVASAFAPDLRELKASAQAAATTPNVSALVAPVTLTDMSGCAPAQTPTVSAEAMTNLKAFVASIAPSLSEDGRAQLVGYLAANGAGLTACIGNSTCELATTLRNDAVHYVVKTTGCTTVPVKASIVPYVGATNGGAP